MWEKIRVIFTIPELRQKILLTLMFLAIYRIGWQIPLPIVNNEAMTRYFKEQHGGLGDILTQVAVFSASQLSQATIFGLGIMPYISASIIFQLLGSVWKPLEELQKEGESGRKKINEYTRYATVALCILQSWMYLGFLMKESARARDAADRMINSVVWDAMQHSALASFGWQLAAVMTMTAGTVFLMWLGEQIDEFGIGNGISLLIMAGILARMPMAGYELLQTVSWQLGSSGGGKLGIEHLLIMVVLFVAVVAGVVFITQGQRRIPTQSAKHVRGRKVFGGTRQYLPLRVNQAGVMPIIFASSLLMIPMLLFRNLAQYGGWLTYLSDMFHRDTSFVYNLL
ncbi:MAG: preprotein translocase subunit SecY, partial [Planctomycetes bacterium]|nr:preprotein translocase subunit SecY [Planctomycetota bacterium]